MDNTSYTDSIRNKCVILLNKEFDNETISRKVENAKVHQKSSILNKKEYD